MPSRPRIWSRWRSPRTCSVGSRSSSRCSSARITRTSARGESRRAARAAVHLGINLAMLGDVAQAGGWFARAQRLVEREESGLPGAGVPAPAARVAARGGRRVRARRGGRGRGRCDRRALRRPRSVRARGARSRQRADQAGALRGGLPAPGRGDAGRDRRRAVADRHRDRLLRCDRGLRGGVRAAARARVDGRAGALVGGAAGAGRVHRPLPRAPGGDPAAARRVAARRSRRRGGRGSGASG